MPLTTVENSATGLSAPAELARPAGLRRWGWTLCLAVLFLVYFVPACMRAASEKLWYDEILTSNVATLVTHPRVLWSFLTELESSPPLGFVMAAGSQALFGRNEFGLRFPSIVEFWIMAVCLYLYLARRLPRPYAIAAMLLTVLTAAGRYSYEARPYALMLALAGIALLAWQAAAEGRGRSIALVMLGASLAAALFSHAMAVTLALPFLAGELTRTVQRKRVDWPVWCAFASATPMLLVLWKMKTAGNEAAYWRFNGSAPWHIFTTYFLMLRPAIVPLVLAFLLLAVLRVWPGSRGQRAAGMRAYEAAALAGFALIPFAAVPISILNGHYFLRYSLNCAIGLAGVAALLLFAIGGTNRLSQAAVMLIFGGAFTIVQFCPEEKRPDFGLKVLNASEKIQQDVERMPTDAPIAICPPLTFVELEHYASPGLASRLYYLTDPAGAAAIDGDILFDVKTPQLARFFPFRSHFEDYHAFVAAHKRFYVVQPVRNIARENALGRLTLEPRETADHFKFYEASAR